MIITLEVAQKYNKEIDEYDLLALETKIRELTNNKFHSEYVRGSNLTCLDKTIVCSDELIGFKVGDTVEVFESKFNNGLYIIEAMDSHSITVDKELTKEMAQSATVVKIEYPFDIKLGVKEILKYKSKMANKIGIKSESISRKSVTYFDVNAQDNTEGVPSSLYSFLNKYRKIRW